MSYDLIIFDCDGTLIDSETLYNSITSEILIEIGYAEYTPALCLELFAGRGWSDMRVILEKKHKIKMPDDIVSKFLDRAAIRMETELVAVERAFEILAALHGKIKICVASNGERNNLLKSLKIMKFDAYFPEAIVFSRIQVARAKPHPDLFLHAAKTMKVAPARALVIEDSVVGVQAGVAAGMDVIGFIGTAHDKERHGEALRDAGAHYIMDSLAQALGHIAGKGILR